MSFSELVDLNSSIGQKLLIDHVIRIVNVYHHNRPYLGKASPEIIINDYEIIEFKDVHLLHSKSLGSPESRKRQHLHCELIELNNPNCYAQEENLHSDLLELNKMLQSKKTKNINASIFISTIPPIGLNYIFKYKYYIIQTRILAAASVISVFQGNESIVSKGFEQILSILKDKNWALLKVLPSFRLNTEDLIFKLNKLLQKSICTQSFIKPIVRMLSKHSEYLDDYLTRVNTPDSITCKYAMPFISVYNIVNTEPPYAPGNTSEKKLLLQKQKPTILEFIKLLNVIKNTLNKQIKYEKIDQSNVARMVTKNILYAKYKAKYIKKKKKSQLTNYEYITEYEVTKLVNYCHKNKFKSAEPVYILLSLFSGWPIKNIYANRNMIKFPEEGDLKKYAIIKSYPEVAKLTVDEKFDDAVEVPTSPVIIVLPKLMKKALMKFPFSCLNDKSFAKKTDKIIKKLNKKHIIHLSVARIGHYLEHRLINSEVDQAEISLITGKKEISKSKKISTSSVDYYQVPTNKLFNIYKCYINRILSNCSKKITIMEIEQVHEGTSGCSLVAKESHVKLLFASLSKKIEQLKKTRKVNIEQFHNLFVTHTILILNLATGHRSVNEPFDRIHHFDLISKRVIINDKAAFRTNVLPDSCVEIVQNYVSYIKKLRNLLRIESAKFTERISNALSGDEPLFFLLENNKIKNIRPSMIDKQIIEIWPLPSNWHRHFMRTNLRKWGVSGGCVDLWMGHETNGDIGLSYYSPYSMADLSDIANKIESFLVNKIEIKCIKV